MSDRVSIDIQNGVADVRLNRPDKMNALDGAMFQAIFEAGRALNEDPDVRAVVLSGAGRCFCSGLDVGNFSGIAQGGGGGTDAGSARSLFDMPEGAIANLSLIHI